MQTKNTTPFLFGTKVTSLQPPQPQMTAIVKATFRLRPGDPLIAVEDLMEQGPLRADTFGDGDDDRVGEDGVYASDFADFKLRGSEVLVKGTCHTPGGRPLAECPVRVSVGAWSKTLVVVGRRVWTEKLIGNAVSEPQPFTAMPLDYAHAFGGPGYAANPSGKGLGTPELPNVEQAAARARSKGDRPEPAGFGPINPVWPQRAGKLGKDYGRAWKKGARAVLRLRFRARTALQRRAARSAARRTTSAETRRSRSSTCTRRRRTSRRGCLESGCGCS